jgi:peptidoglycan/LPS O-acetylase OafA/YrhL
VAEHATYFFVNPPVEAYLAVDFFFTLSGFVLAHAYGQRLREGMTATHFMALRIIRLYPLYVLALVPWLPVGWKAITRDGTDLSALAIDVATAVLFIPSPMSSILLYPLNPPAWSLFFELIANAGFGIMGKRLGNGMLCFIVSASAFVLIGATANGAGPMAGNTWDSIGGGFLRVAFSFFAGILVYRLWLFRPPRINVPAPIIALLLIAVMFSHPAERYQAAYSLVASIVVFPSLIWLAASSRPHRRVARLWAWLGPVSYAIYVLHFPIYILMTRILEKLLYPGLESAGWKWGIFFIGFVVVVSDVADRCYDVPVRKRLLRQLEAGRGRPLRTPERSSG